ncbi:MAG: DNA replication/repair protein RecF [Proteobacteria bacterium]|nr:DNA replication/repair protein RecF [Pseudomonadota bacterium]
MFPIRLKNLTLTQFRCYSSLKLLFEERIIIFTGPNGAGKTNILEAISFLNPGRGLRQAKLLDLLKIPSQSAESSLGWVISACLTLPRGNCQIGTGLAVPIKEGETEKRLIRVDGVDLNSQNQLEKILSVLWMTPAMDRLLSEGPSQRRKLLDKFISSIDPEHSKRLYRYEYALRERSRLLKENRNDPLWLGALEEKMALEGVALTASRQEMIELLMSSMNSHRESFPTAFLILKGEIEKLLKCSSALEVEEVFKQRLKDARAYDRISGGASLGPHLSDLDITHVQKNISISLCSTGEQKVLLISLILAHLRIHALRRKETPLLLLDEGMVHLDTIRREALFEELDSLNVQTFFTGTDRSAFEAAQGKAQFFEVQSGDVMEK